MIYILLSCSSGFKGTLYFSAESHIRGAKIEKMKTNASSELSLQGESSAYRDVSAHDGILNFVSQVIHGQGVLHRADVRPIVAPWRTHGSFFKSAAGVSFCFESAGNL